MAYQHKARQKQNLPEGLWVLACCGGVSVGGRGQLEVLGNPGETKVTATQEWKETALAKPTANQTLLLTERALILLLVLS